MTGMVGININTNTEMTDMTKLEVGQRKNLAHMVIKIVIVLTQNLKNCTKSCHGMTSEEVTAIRSMLMTSEYTKKVMDSTCLMAARVEYAISQKSKGLAKDIHDNISNTSSHSDINPVNYGPESLGTGLTQNADSEEKY